MSSNLFNIRSKYSLKKLFDYLPAKLSSVWKHIKNIMKLKEY